MRNLLILLCLGMMPAAVAADNLFPNGNLKQTLNYVPLAELAASRGFIAAAPWPAGILIDTASQPCVMRYDAAENPRLIIENPESRESTIYTAAEFKPGTYKLRFRAKGLKPGSAIKVRLYRYNVAKKWAGGVALHQFRLDDPRLAHVVDFTENTPDAVCFRIAFSVLGDVSLGDIELIDTAAANEKKALPPSEMLLDEAEPPGIGERGSLIRKFAPVKPGKQTVLEFEHRIDFPRLGGWAPCMQIEVNDRVVTGMATRKHPRLLNSGLATPGHMDHGTYKRCYSDKWYSFYSPDFEAAKSRFSPVNPEAYRVRLDISDLVNSHAGNTLRIRFGSDLSGYYRSVGVTDRKPALALRNLSIRRFDAPSPLPPGAPSDEDTRIVMRRKPPVRFNAVLRPDGGIAVKLGESQFDIAGLFSAPDAHNYALGISGKDQWNLLKVDGNTLVAKNPYYILRRSLEILPNRIDVTDRFQSGMPELGGIRFSYRIPSDSFDPVYLAGDSSPIHQEKNGGRNPSVFLADRKAGNGLGLVAVDDVFRVQNRQFCRDGAAGIGSENLALPPGGEQTVEWSIYPVNSADYFDFVNQVRRDWDVNFPIRGGFHLSMNSYGNWDKSGANRFADKIGLAFQSFGVLFWRHLGGEFSGRQGAVHGFGLMLDKVRGYPDFNETVEVEPMRRFVRENLARCKEYTPQLKRLIYVHQQYSNEPGDEEKYADCRLIDLSGRRRDAMNGYYKLFVPTLENEFGRRQLEFLKYLLDNFDLDGIYGDEFTYSISFTTSRMWDDVSVELDERNNVKRKIGFVPLLKLPFLLKVMDYVLRERGREFVANFSPETRSELKFRFPRFEETYDPSWVFYSHLYTPIQLGDMLVFSGSPAEFMDDVRNALRRGALYYHYMSSAPDKTITAYMYPFTPVELHRGYLVGRERILTIYSGEYGIPGEALEYDALVFGPDGAPLPDHPYENIETPDGIKCRIELEKGQCAVLIKRG